MDTAAGWGGRAPSSVDLLDKCLNLSPPQGSKLPAVVGQSQTGSQLRLKANPNHRGSRRGPRPHSSPNYDCGPQKTHSPPALHSKAFCLKLLILGATVLSLNRWHARLRKFHEKTRATGDFYFDWLGC